MSAVAGGEFEAGVDALRGALGQGDADVGRMRRDEVGGGIEPDVAIDGALGADETVDQGDERSGDIAVTGGEDRVAFGDERRQEAIAGLQPLADQRLGDGLGLVAMVEIADDAEQVSRVDAVGKRAGGALAGEDRDGIDDGVARIAGDGVAEVALGIEQAEAGEGVVE